MRGDGARGHLIAPDGIDFGGRIKRMDRGPTDDPAQPLTFDTLYFGSSRRFVGCPTVDQSGSYGVTAHSGACALVAVAGDQDKGATGVMHGLSRGVSRASLHQFLV
nr:Morn repeat incomplete domain containing protein [Pandoravirus belohorizontensis]